MSLEITMAPDDFEARLIRAAKATCALPKRIVQPLLGPPSPDATAQPQQGKRMGGWFDAR